ncbi:hypothetical protein ABPG74_008791 [Tetrahymena malaccensis]
MSFQNQDIHDDLNEMQKLTKAQEDQFKQQNDNDYDQVGTSGYQEIIKRSRENSIDSARSRSRSINERKRNYNRQQNSNEEESPSNTNQNSRTIAQRSNHFYEQNDDQNDQNQVENDLNSNNTTGVDFSKMNFNQSLQQLQEMVNKVEVPVIKLDNQAGYRHARRLYIGNIPETINQEYLSEWLYRSLEAAGGLQPSLPSENPIVKCEIDPKGRFAFTELRSIEETTALLQLDGIILVIKSIIKYFYHFYLLIIQWHRQLRIRRPTEYEKFPKVQGQFEANIPKLNFDLFKTVGIVIIPTIVDDGPNKIFLANLPTKMDELMILDELKLRDMGEIKAFHLVKDNQTNQSKGYAFFEFKDPSLTENCIETLHGMQYAGRTLTCKRSQIGGIGNKQISTGNKQQNNSRNSNQSNSMGGNNNLQRQSFSSENIDSIQGQNQQGLNEGSGFFPNYQSNTQGGSNNQNKGMSQNYQNNSNNHNNNNKRRNFGNQNNSNNNYYNNNGAGMNNGNNNNGNNRRFQNNNNMNHNQQGQFANGGNKFNKGHGNNNGMSNKKQNQWNGQQNNQIPSQDNQSGISSDGYYEGSSGQIGQQYDVNQMYNYQQSQQGSHYMMQDQSNPYQ